MTPEERDRAESPDAVIGGPGGLVGFRMLANDVEQNLELPHPAVTLVFQLGEQMTIGDRQAATNERAVVVGVNGRPTRTEVSGMVECIELRLCPLTSFGLFGGMPMTELAAGPTDLAALDGQRVAEAVERAVISPTWTGRFGAVRDLLRTLTDEAEAAGVRADPEVEQAWRLLLESDGTARIGDLSTATGWSTSRLRRRFEAQVGMTPKRAGRLIRFDKARKLLAVGATPADTAIACGFVDQSHLHRDVREFADSTPAELGGGATPR